MRGGISAYQRWTMRLSGFIRTNTENISTKWGEFAATLLPEREFSKSMLRDGIVEILNEIAADMESPQTGKQQQEKSEGSPGPSQDIKNAASGHALARVRMGLSSRQLISEFRALRATIIRLWHQRDQPIDQVTMDDMIRFNESVDQVLSEAEARYSREVGRSRELFLSILGHDLRSPLGAIRGSAELLQRAKGSDRGPKYVAQILNSAGRMSHMITDLIELARVQLGSGISVKPTEADMKRACLEVIDEMKALYPERAFELVSKDDVLGEWDMPRIKQVLSNLLGNAVQHGAPKSAIRLSVRSSKNTVELHVHNEGDPIPSELRDTLFESFVREETGTTSKDDQSSLGLGLYIAKEVVVAHGGTIEARSSAGKGTTIIARLPRATQHNSTRNESG